MFTPQRFWGHPDDWSEEAYSEYCRLLRSRRLIDRFRCWLWRF